MPDLDELWIPLVDEPIGGIVDRVLRDDSALAARVETPHRILAFRTFAYIRTGILLGRLLFDNDVPDWDGSESWVDALLRDPAAPRSSRRYGRSRRRSRPILSTPTTGRSRRTTPRATASAPSRGSTSARAASSSAYFALPPFPW